jgi:hypothetical protein
MNKKQRQNSAQQKKSTGFESRKIIINNLSNSLLSQWQSKHQDF